MNTPFTLSLTENKRDLVFDSLGNFISSLPFILKEGRKLERKLEPLYYLPLAEKFLCLVFPENLSILFAPFYRPKPYKFSTDYYYNNDLGIYLPMAKGR